MLQTFQYIQADDLRQITNNHPNINNDIIAAIIGKPLGEGLSRNVFEYNLNPEKYVIKLETTNYRSNASEIILWNEIQGLKGPLSWVKDWFAPILWHSPNSLVLVMERTYQDPNRKKPDRIPSFFQDVAERNFGWLNNKFVCHDYGSIYGFIKYSNKFKKANWEES